MNMNIFPDYNVMKKAPETEHQGIKPPPTIGWKREIMSTSTM